MRGYYRLLNTELQAMGWGLWALCGAAIVVPLLLLQLTVSGMSVDTALRRYEDIYAASGSIAAFVLLLVLLLGLFAVSLYRNYWGSKSIYTLLTLPVRAGTVYWSKLSAYALALLLFLLAHLVGARLGYGLVQGAVERYSSEDWTMAGGWFLAVARSSFFRLLLPLTWEGVLSSVSMALALLTGLFYAILLERSRRWFGLPFVSVIILIREFNLR
ncbi:ABC transporter permease, partial [Paenibacillus sp. 598K]|uniref:ABC transporter permease n=1 Tax=Paenibacillus sp. 598K TaxID=1117987 RepID=UPI0011D031AA